MHLGKGAPLCSIPWIAVPGLCTVASCWLLSLDDAISGHSVRLPLPFVPAAAVRAQSPRTEKSRGDKANPNTWPCNTGQHVPQKA